MFSLNTSDKFNFAFIGKLANFIKWTHNRECDIGLSAYYFPQTTELIYIKFNIREDALRHEKWI
jgi:hypothetical protein